MYLFLDPRHCEGIAEKTNATVLFQICTWKQATIFAASLQSFSLWHLILALDSLMFGRLQILICLALDQISDAAVIESMVDAIIAENPKQVAAYRGGKTKLQGFFVGQVGIFLS
jgi:hypothetical protein